jgi:WhiB family redox-sensing transcriptional regulator
MPSSHAISSAPGWMPRGACQGQDPGLFFPATVTGPARAQVFAAKAVCFRCAVRAACLSYALATRQAGIWGGTTQEERHAMRQPSGPLAHRHSGGAAAAAPSLPAGYRGSSAG